MKRWHIALLAGLLAAGAFLACRVSKDSSPAPQRAWYTTDKPFTRWWWFASEIDTRDVEYQLNWLKDNHFGGVEIAFMYPFGNDPNARRYAWLSREFIDAVTFAKRHCDRIGLGFDLTFGTLWPFGDSRVPEEEGAIQFGETTSPKTMHRTWELPESGRVIDHLSRIALDHYADRLGSAFAPVMTGKPTGLFCDSWEVETRKMWTRGFDKKFQQMFGYDIGPHMDNLLSPGNEEYFYDYMRLVSELVLDEFYKPFTDISHKLGGFSRVQCEGAPTDIIAAFAAVDVPESEAILYEPAYSLIPSSAAALASKSIVSAETFTCAYGWMRWPGPGPYQGKEQVADLKLICDALFAHGVNMIVWHGTPFNGRSGTNRFYASVHVGETGSLAPELPSFNRYMEKVSAFMRTGKVYTDVAEYLPLEDSWMNVAYPKELQYPWVWGQYELRYVRPATRALGYHPLWVNHEFLKSGTLKDRRLLIGDAVFSALVIGADYLEAETLKTTLKLAQSGFPIWLKTDPREPGRKKSAEYAGLLAELKAQPSVKNQPGEVLPAKPLVEGKDLPDFFARTTGTEIYIFFSNPKAMNLKYPLTYGQSFTEQPVKRQVTIHAFGRSMPLTLTFNPYQSLLVQVPEQGAIRFEDIVFVPKTPVVDNTPIIDGAKMPNPD